MNLLNWPRIAAIPGWLAQEEAEALYEGARSLVPSPESCGIIEIGSYCGRSTVCLAQGLKDGGVAAHVIAVDPYHGSAEHQIGATCWDPTLTRSGEVNTFELFRKIVQDFGLEEYVIPIVQASRHVAKLGLKADLVFIDGNHEYAEVRFDAQHFVPVSGGMTYIHDYGQWPGPTQVADELLQKGWRTIRRVWDLIVLQKVDF